MAAWGTKRLDSLFAVQLQPRRATTDLGGCKRTLQRRGNRAALVDRRVDRHQLIAGIIDGGASDFPAQASMVSGAQVDRHHGVPDHVGAPRLALVPPRPAAGRDARLATA